VHALRLKTSDIDIEVKYKKAGNELLVPKPKIVMRTEDGKLVEQVRVVTDRRFKWKGKDLGVEVRLFDPDTQKQVPSSEALEILEHFGYRFLDEDGNEIRKIKDERGKNVLPVRYFIVKDDGTEEEISPFPRTDVIEVAEENWVPSTSIDGFLIESVYEIFSDSPVVLAKLYEEAEKRLKKDQIGLTTFSWGGFTQYYAFLCPEIRDGKFVWLLKLTNTKLTYNHMQDIPAKVKIPIRKAPTLKTLPPVQMLVVAAKKKKKKK